MRLPVLYSREWFIVDPQRLWVDDRDAATFRRLADIRAFLRIHHPDMHVVPHKDGHRLIRPGRPDLLIVCISRDNRCYYQRLVERHVFAQTP